MWDSIQPTQEWITSHIPEVNFLFEIVGYNVLPLKKYMYFTVSNHLLSSL